MKNEIRNEINKINVKVFHKTEIEIHEKCKKINEEIWREIWREIDNKITYEITHVANEIKNEMCYIIELMRMQNEK